MEEQGMVEMDVPSYFLCPITLDIMRDPVTLPTGITYDRHAIHRWLRLADGAMSATCPLTKLPVAPDCELTPNHTLRRLIHSWCALHKPDTGVDGVSTPPKPTADRARLDELVSRLADAKRLSSPSRDLETLAALQELRDAAAEGERARELVAELPGVADALFAVLASTSAPENADAALDVISSLQLSERCLVRVVDRDGTALVDALISTLRRDADEASRERAAVLLADVTACMAPGRVASLPEQVFVEAVRLLRREDRGASTSAPASKAALHVLAGATSHGRNRIKAVEAGAVAALVEVLLLASGGRRYELALCALDRLCGCAGGRAALVAHAAGIAAVGAKVAGASVAASGKAVRVLRSVARHAATAEVVREMAATGAVRNLCVVALSPETPERTRERAREMLRMHTAVWRSSPCLRPNLQALYPC